MVAKKILVKKKHIASNFWIRKNALVYIVL